MEAKKEQPNNDLINPTWLNTLRWHFKFDFFTVTINVQSV